MVELNKHRDFISFVGSILVGILFFFTVVIILLTLALRKSGGVFTYIFVGFFSLIVGFFYVYLQDKYHNSDKFRIRSNVFFSTIVGAGLFVCIRLLHFLSDFSYKLSNDPSFISNDSFLLVDYININEYILVLVVVLCFSFANILTFVKEKKYLNLFYFILPIILSIFFGLLISQNFILN